MGYELNSKAYGIFVQIEVGLREYFIKLINDFGILNWFQEFLGSIQRDNLNEISKRIAEIKKSGGVPSLEDVYLSKLEREKRIDESFNNKNLFHPFYYLNWTDFEALIRMKVNSQLFEKSIGLANKDIIVEILKRVTYLRNDIAHSRFISESDFDIIKSSYLHISSIIPNFHSLKENQSQEENLQHIIDRLKKTIFLVKENELLDIISLNEIIQMTDNFLNSFWINSIRNDIVSYLIIFKDFIGKYREFRLQRGGILSITKLKKENTSFLLDFLNCLNNGKI